MAYLESALSHPDQARCLHHKGQQPCGEGFQPAEGAFTRLNSLRDRPAVYGWSHVVSANQVEARLNGLFEGLGLWGFTDSPIGEGLDREEAEADSPKPAETGWMLFQKTAPEPAVERLASTQSVKPRKRGSMQASTDVRKLW